ncbi:hypothetical protein OS493_004013, partial [Desmophyllum pertusum]
MDVLGETPRGKTKNITTLPVQLAVSVGTVLVQYWYSVGTVLGLIPVAIMIPFDITTKGDIRVGSDGLYTKHGQVKSNKYSKWGAYGSIALVTTLSISVIALV